MKGSDRRYSYTLHFTYAEDIQIQEALRLLKAETKDDIQEALRTMLLTGAEKTMNKSLEKQKKKKRSAWRYLTPGVGGIYLLQDTAKAASNAEETEKGWEPWWKKKKKK